jgi:hypothetical protein
MQLLLWACQNELCQAFKECCFRLRILTCFVHHCGCMQVVAVPGQQHAKAVQLASSPRSASSSKCSHMLQAGTAVLACSVQPQQQAQL